MKLLSCGEVSTLLELTSYIPTRLRKIENIQTAIPDIAKNKNLIDEINSSVQTIPTIHSSQSDFSRPSLI